ncbi:hypothetical protein PoMZ_07275 [Pyricularia oryzae]|uniref:Uncharacterized protein n=1 Tax=Pyricularia oryzae TaxID=318829 RepID=A0A4P7NEQ5_PYROR|nr:hypothetical protein PoMZ_07275 [Pyricularia oryzae]
MHKLRVPICYNGYTYYVTDGEAALSAPRTFSYLCGCYPQVLRRVDPNQAGYRLAHQNISF